MRGASFFNGVAFKADQKKKIVPDVGLLTANECVQGLHPMDQPLFDQKVQRTVDRCGLGAGIEILEGFKKVIGLDRFVVGPDEFQNFSADWSEADATSLAERISSTEGGIQADSVVMRGHGLVSLASPEEPVLGTQWEIPYGWVILNT